MIYDKYVVNEWIYRRNVNFMEKDLFGRVKEIFEEIRFEEVKVLIS